MSPAELRRYARLAATSEEAARAQRLPAPKPEEQPRSERHLHLVRDQSRQPGIRRHIAVLMVIGVVAVISMGLVALHVLIAEAQFRLDSLEQQASAQQARYERLRLDVAQLESPSRIVSVAEGDLGMRQPGSVTYLPATSVPAGPSTGSSPGGGPVVPGVGGGGLNSSSSAPQGDADWPMIKPYLSGSP